MADRADGSLLVVPRAPLLAPVLLLIVGYLLARTLAELPAALFLIVGLIHLSGGLLLRGPSLRWPRIISLGLAGIFLSGSWFGFRASPPDAAWTELPPRETTLTIEILHPWKPDRERNLARGLARVTEAPPVLADLNGQRLIYRISGAMEDLPRGVSVSVAGVLEPLNPQTDNDFLRSMAERGISFEFRRARLEQPPEPAGAWRAFFSAANERVSEILRGDGSTARDTLTALFLGRRQLLDPDQDARFIETGTRHLFAVSGLHVGLVALVLWWTFRLAQIPVRWVAVLVAVVLLLYVETTGGAPSARRTWLMTVTYLFATLVSRQPSALPALALSALVTLLVDPWQLFDPGFQLSYCVVFGLIVYVSPAVHAFRRFVLSDPDRPPRWGLFPNVVRQGSLYVFSLFAVGWAAFLASAPLSAHLFGIFTPGSVFLGVALSLPALLAVGTAVFASLFGLIGLTPLAELAAHLGALVIELMTTVVIVAPEVPGLFYRLSSPGVLPTWLAQTALLAALASAPVLLKRGHPFLAFSLAPTALLVMLGVTIALPSPSP